MRANIDNAPAAAPHLHQMRHATVAKLAAVVNDAYGDEMPHTLRLELSAFVASRTFRDGARMARALKFACDRPDLAEPFELAIGYGVEVGVRRVEVAP
jgi:hypothetical protein